MVANKVATKADTRLDLNIITLFLNFIFLIPHPGLVALQPEIARIYFTPLMLDNAYAIILNQSRILVNRRGKRSLTSLATASSPGGRATVDIQAGLGRSAVAVRGADGRAGAR